MGDSPGHVRQLRVLQVLTLADAAFGGPAVVAKTQARALAQRRHAVVVTGLTHGAQVPPKGLRRRQWRMFPARRLVPGAGMLGLLNPRLVRFLWKATGTADVVHVHAGRDLVSLTALVIAWVRRTPFVAQTHGMVLPRTHLRARVFDPVFLRLLRRARAVLFMTESERGDLERLLGRQVPLRFLGNGVALPALTRQPRRAGRTTVLFMARLHPVKRVDAFAQMAGLLARDGVEADFVVYGPDQGSLQALRNIIRREGLESVVHYRGVLEHDEAVSRLGAADVYVLPSSADWMPMSLLEALAAGVPSVCTKACGLAPTLAAAAAARVVDGTVEDLAQAVKAILTDPEEQCRLTEAARQLITDRFSVDAVTAELERIYSDALRPHRTRAAILSRLSVPDRCSRE